MADTFQDLGLGEAAQKAAAAAGYDGPTALQAGAIPVLRRGGNVVLHASSGAGVTAAIALPLLDRLGAGGSADGPRALVLAPTPQRAERIAQAMSSLLGDSDLSVRTAAPGWRAPGADILVLSPQRTLEAVQTSELKLDALETFVITDAAELFALKGGSALETIIPLIPKDAQRVVASAKLEGEVQAFIDAHVRKAITVPPRPAAPPRNQPAAEAIGQLGYMIVEDAAKADTLARLLESVEEDALVHVRSVTRAEGVERDLRARGITGVRVRTFSDAAGAASRVVSYDVPFTVDELRAVHANGGTVLVTPAERAHFRRIAAEAPFTVKQRRARTMDVGDLETFRASVRAAIDSEDLDSQLLVLEPLLDEFSPAEIAAALSAMVRRREPARAPGASVASAAATGSAPAAASAGGLTRLFVSVGSRDNIRPGDIVGAITGEANVKGDQVGRVDIRESFSVVEVATAVAERVIRALNGTTMRGRSLRVDFDRKNVSGGGSGPRERSGPRDGGSRGPRDAGSRGPRSGPREGGGPGGPRSGPPRRRPPQRDG